MKFMSIWVLGSSFGGAIEVFFLLKCLIFDLLFDYDTNNDCGAEDDEAHDRLNFSLIYKKNSYFHM